MNKSKKKNITKKSQATNGIQRFSNTINSIEKQLKFQEKKEANMKLRSRIRGSRY